MKQWFKNTGRIAIMAVTFVAVFAVTDFILNEWRMRRIPKNFSTVKPNILYRSGQIREEHFEQVLVEHGIKTVVCLNPHTVNYEKPIADKLGVNYVAFDMPGSGIGKPEYFHEFLRIASDPNMRPVLVHCAAGAYRTGVAVGVYRMHFDGWSIDDVIDEMDYSGCAIYSDQPLIDHVQKVYDSIPIEMKQEVEPGYGSTALAGEVDTTKKRK